MINSIVIASTAGFLINPLREKLHEVDYRVFVVSNDNDLWTRVNSSYPRYIFIENCFYNKGTDVYIQKIKRLNENLRIVIWTCSDFLPSAAARFIYAGAESFFSMRDTEDNIEKIINGIVILGKKYCPDDVSKVFNSDIYAPLIGVPFTNREIQIIKLMDRKDTEIARELNITIHAVKFHKANISRKCGEKRKNEIIKYAVKHGIINANEE